MAEAKKQSEELIEIFVERAQGKEDPNLFVGINGSNYLLPRGKTSKVPKDVYDEIMRGRTAQAAADDNIDNLKEAAK